MSIVAGVDFGTLSVRVSIFDSEKGRLGAGIGEYPLHRRRDDPDHATQSHTDQMNALVEAMRKAVQTAGIDGRAIEALACDTTGSSVVPVDAAMQPLNEYYLWCDHRSAGEAALITRTAHEAGLPAIDYCGGMYSSEWGFSKLLHWLRHHPEQRAAFASAFEHCDMVAATLCGITDPSQVRRSVCAMGHKWLWNKSLGGLPPEEFLTSVDPVLAGVRDQLAGEYATSDAMAGTLSEEWAGKMGLRAGIPIPVGAFDAHWDAIGAGCKLGDVVNVIGTSTCIIAMSDKTELIPGVCGVVPGSVHPGYTGIEAGMSAVGDVFDAIARRAHQPLAELSQGIAGYRAGQTGLLRLTWDNGDRTVLVNPELGGVTLGWHLTHTAEDELFAAIEGTALHTRIIFERMQEHGAPIERVINAGGVPRKNAVLNQVYANALNKPILVPQGDVTSLGSVIFAFLAAGTYKSVEEAQAALCPAYDTFTPQPEAVAVYDRLFALYRRMYFGLGTAEAAPVSIGDVLPSLRRIAAEARRA